ncbi:coiled-coil domain-containing protein 170 [Pyxicephalus adspersus]|uniref:coiled-coil domain-containing protein 170 n=1 Tax=Pyxicephalus adspersus TaxID=30357 RepID=UPI003B5C430F
MSTSSLSNNSDRPSPSSVPGAKAAYESRHHDGNRNSAFHSVSPAVSLRGEEPETQEYFKRNRIPLELMHDTVETKNGKRNKKRGDAKKHAYDSLFADIPITREQMNHYRIIAENSHSELAALHVKYESAQSELLDLRTKLSSKEMALQELKAEVENYRENNARQSAMITSLRARVQETEEETGLLATSKSRAELTIQTVLHENRELKDKIQDLESRFRTYMAQWEDSKSQASRYSRNYGHFLAQLSACLNTDIKGQKDPEELVINKNLESVSDAKHALEKENVMLQDRLKASQKAWEASKQELNQVKKSSTELDMSLKNSVGEAKAVQSMLDSFKDEVATALSDASITVKPKEEAILDRIHDLQKKVESKKVVTTQLESRVSKLNDQLQNQADLHQEALLRAKKAEQQLEEFWSRLKVAEGELVSGDVMRDNLSYEKQKYMKFLEQLSEKMRLDRITADVGFDMRLDVILARADQLVKLESDAVIENKTLAQNLQRKLKAQKEKFESKELHMELLRKKIAQLEEEKQVRTALAVERDEANLTVRTLQKKVERLQKDLGAAQQSVTELKSRLSETNELKIKTLEQHKTIEQLNKSMEQLEKVKGKTEKRLQSVKSELEFTEREAKEEKEKTGNYMDVITSELKTLKKTLEEVSKREKQLIDFREVVSHLLGLNVNNLALPDYEIIKRLEGLVHSHHHHVVSCA